VSQAISGKADIEVSISGYRVPASQPGARESGLERVGLVSMTAPTRP
jgi:hypothetical protein